MNTIDFTKTGGMPVDQSALQFMQSGYNDLLKQLGSALGEYIILNGSQQLGGWVSVNGEIMPFDAGSGENCYIRETKESVVYQDGENKAVYTTQKLVFGMGTPQLKWSDFQKINPLIELQFRLAKLEQQTAVFQKGGGMVLWNKPANEIPKGWQEVVDWRGRMPVGWNGNDADFNEIGKTAGQKNISLNQDNLPGVGIKYFDSYWLEAKDYGAISGVEIQPGNYNGSSGVRWGNRYLHYKIRYTDPLGKGTAINLMNPYRVVLFIEYIG